MSRLEKIRAEHLMWCYSGFPFYSNDENCKHLLICTEYTEEKLISSQRCFGDWGHVYFRPTKFIKVNPGEYAQVVIERILQVVHLALNMYKHRITKSLGRVTIEFNEKGTWKILTPIHVDPRPWEPKYTINLEKTNE